MVNGERIWLGNATCEKEGVERRGVFVKVVAVTGANVVLEINGERVETGLEEFRANTWQPRRGGPYAEWITGYQHPDVGTKGWIDPLRFLEGNLVRGR